MCVCASACLLGSSPIADKGHVGRGCWAALPAPLLIQPWASLLLQTEPATADTAVVPAPAAEDTNMQDEPAAEGASTATGNLEPDTGELRNIR